jgi:hypothetical protein
MKTRGTAIACLGLAALAATVLGRFTFGGNALLGVDLLEQSFPPYVVPDAPPPRNLLDADPVVCTFPREASAGARLRAGQPASRWEPGLGAGEPTYLDNATAPDYPPWRIAFTIFPAWLAHGVLIVSHLALALSGAFLLARARGLRPRSALVAALVYGLSGHLSVWLELDLWTIAAAWLPWALLGLELGGPRGIALSGLALGASILGGHLQVAALGCALALVWRPRRAVLALLLGLALGAPRLVPALFELGESSRERIPFAHWFEETGSLTPERLRLLVVPDREDPVGRARLAYGKLETQGNAQELRLSPGVVALALALLAATRRKNARLALLALSVLLLAMPTPLAWLLWRFAPGFGATTPTRVLSLFPLLVGLLAAAGLEVFEERPRAAALAFAFVAAEVVLDGAFGGGFLGRAIQKPLGLTLAALSAAFLADGPSRPWKKAAAAILVAAVAFDLAEATARWNPTGPPSRLYPDTPALDAARDLALRPAEGGGRGRVLADRGIGPDLLLPKGLDNVGSYGSSHPARYAHLVDALGQRAASPPLATPTPSRQWLFGWRTPAPWRDALSVRAVVATARFGASVPQELALVASGQVLVFENRGSLPRARVFPERAVHVAADEASALALARTIDPRRELVIEDGAPRAGSPADASLAEIVQDEPERVEVVARAAEPSVLCLMDTDAAGWRVRVDGFPADILHADVAFRGVKIPRGEHEVVFEHVPPLQGLTSLLGGVASIALAAMLLGVRRR